MSAPVEKKVKAASIASLVAAFVVAWIVTTVPALSGLAGPLQATVIGVLGSAAAWVAGWLAQHTPRPVSGDQTRYPSRR